MIRILLADDHAVVRQGLRMFLALDPELEVVGEAANGAQALEQVSLLHPDVVLMDLKMPVMDGLTAIRHIRAAHPDTEVIAVTSVLEDTAIIDAVRAGAIGYLLKDTEAQELVISEKTVKTHASSILSKLGLASRTQAALHAMRLGLVGQSEG